MGLEYIFDNLRLNFEEKVQELHQRCVFIGSKGVRIGFDEERSFYVLREVGSLCCLFYLDY